jgi:carbon storage regulator
MLVLTRRIGESIMIGDTVIVTVVEVKGKQTKLGIVAPNDVVVDREEIYDKKTRELKAPWGF